MKIIKAAVTFLLITVILSGCKPSVESEMRQYRVNIGKINSRRRKFPNAAVYLTDLKKQAKIEWAKVMQIKDNEKKAKEMDRVNDFITNDPVFKEISNLFYYMRNIRDRMEYIDSLRTSGRPTRLRLAIKDAKLVSAKAKLAISKVKREIRDAEFSTKMAAASGFSRVNSLLSDIRSDLDRKYHKIRDIRNKLKQRRRKRRR